MEREIRQEQILVRITGQDRPGLTASIMGILAKYDAQILDIGQIGEGEEVDVFEIIRLKFGREHVPEDLRVNKHADAGICQLKGVFDMPNPYGMMPTGGNKYALTAASGEAEVVETVVPVQGYLESSKTDIATEMVRMIEASRAFPMNAKVVTTADEIEQTVNSLR